MPTQVRKILRDEGLRQSVEASWQREKAHTASLEVLSRCKALNAFVKKGLLAEVEEDDTAAAAAAGRVRTKQQQHASRRSALPAPVAAAVTAAAHPQHGKTRAASSPGSAAPPPAPLTSRLTAKESEALLGLLLLEEEEQEDAAVAVPATAFSTDPAAVADTASSSCSQQGSSSPDARASEGQPGSALQPATPATTTGSEMLDDVIGLLNAPDTAAAVVASLHPACAQPDRKQQQQQQRMSPLPPPACREAHRQRYVRPPHQQLDLQAAADRHASINAAWSGFYSYWGPHAARTIQHYWRAHKARQQYVQLRAAALVLQAACRGHLLRVSPTENLLRLHREQQQWEQREQEQLAEQREREAAQQAQREEAAAAVVLQCAVRSWAARRLLCRQLQTTAATADAAPLSGVASVCSSSNRGASDSCSSTGSCSRGSSRESHSRGSTATQDQEAEAYELPGLVIRSAADTRTASHCGGGDAAGACCTEALARQLVARAGQLGVVEGLAAAEQAERALMASSSSRQLSSVLSIVRGGVA